MSPWVFLNVFVLIHAVKAVVWGKREEMRLIMNCQKDINPCSEEAKARNSSGWWKLKGDGGFGDFAMKKLEAV